MVHVDTLDSLVCVVGVLDSLPEQSVQIPFCGRRSVVSGHSDDTNPNCFQRISSHDSSEQVSIHVCSHQFNIAVSVQLQGGSQTGEPGSRAAGRSNCSAPSEGCKLGENDHGKSEK